MDSIRIENGFYTNCQNHVHPEPRVSCKSHAQFKNRIKMRFISTQCNSPRIPMPTANYLQSSKLALHFNSVVHIVYSLASNLATLYFSVRYSSLLLISQPSILL